MPPSPSPSSGQPDRSQPPEPAPDPHAGRPAASDGARSAFAGLLERRAVGPVAPSAGAVDDAVAMVAARPPGQWSVRCRPAATELLAGHPARGTVVEVVGDDRPLIVTSVEEELRSRGLRTADLTALAFGTERDADGRLVDVGSARDSDHPEALLQLELDQPLDDEAAAEAVSALTGMLELLTVVTTDHGAIRQRLSQVATTLSLIGPDSGGGDEEADLPDDPLVPVPASGGSSPDRGGEDPWADAVATIRWLLDGNALLLGLARRPPDEPDRPPPDEAPDLGLLRVDPDLMTARDTGRPTARHGRPLVVTRLNRLSRVHRRVPVLRLDLWRPDPETGEDAVEHLLWVVARRAAGAPLASVPLLRRKLDRLLEREDVVPGSYDEQHLTLLFQSLPEDDLFSLDDDALHSLVTELRAEDRDHSVRVVLRPVAESHSVAALVTVPVERWNRALRERLGRFLRVQLDGDRIDVALSIGGGSSAVTARFVVHLPDAVDPPDQLDAVAREVRLICRSWEEELVAVIADRGEAVPCPPLAPPGTVAGRWVGRLPESYRDAVPARDAVRDVLELDRMVEGVEGDEPPGTGPDGDGGVVRVWFGARRAPDRPERLCLATRRDLELSRLLPGLESLGLWITDEARWSVGDGVHLHHLGVRVRPGPGDDAPGAPGRPAGRAFADPEVASRLGAAIAALVAGRAEVDGLNRLVVRADLRWEDVSILRAYRRYRHQIDPRDDESHVDDVIVTHPDLARALVALWQARFGDAAENGGGGGGGADDADGRDGADGRRARAEAASRVVREACDALPRLDHDRILRGIGGAMDATLRTNRHLRPEGPLALKIDTSLVPDAPHPRPFREIFVSGRTVEGVHLRAGTVARGGIRASDRDHDYRTEVLGLMRAQVLKNAVIVPTGAKGGFVLRSEPDAPTGVDRRELLATAYDAFIGALLDVTDDLDGDEVRAVPGRWDGDDPYLVVAPDKGTAAFSDRANALAEARGFWLGDAFASGGSRGYDHKELGITARGAWVAIERHLRALGLDSRRDEISVVGVGDMSGDVFGNGLLHSDRLRLLAAFDHRHVFLDPDPDPEASYGERRRLFDLPRSSWADYDPDLISPGGGVHPRSAKAITLTAEVKEALRIDADRLDPSELIRAVLSAPVDLLYFGGIGTYVRASSEDEGRIDDRTNSDVRVTGLDLRARVIGEGANLAMTQRARVEVARRGGRVNVDAIDNSAGVDCSDHEVNLKVLLALAETRGAISRAERDQLMTRHVDDVVDAVLWDCAAQSEALDRAERATPSGMATVAVVLERLVAEGILDPEVEALPDRGEIESRAAAGAGFTRPELAVLLAGVKRRVVAEVLASDLPDEPVCRDALVGYFPADLAERFDDLLDHHRLRRELVASEIANDLVDHLGLTAVVSLSDELGADVPDVAAAYWVARGVVRAPERWQVLYRSRGATVPDLDPHPVDGGDLLSDLLRHLTRSELVRRRRDLRRGQRWDPVARIEADRTVADALVARQDHDDDQGRRLERDRLATRLVAGGLDPAAAPRAAGIVELEMVPDGAEVARDLGLDPAVVADAFRAVDDQLGLDDLRRRAQALPLVGEWELAARQGLLDDLVGVRREAARQALEAAPADAPAAEAVARLLDGDPAARAEARSVHRRLDAGGDVGLDALAVAVRAARRAAL